MSTSCQPLFNCRMVRPEPLVRRQADPQIVQKLWTSIASIRAQKQVANLERLVRHMQREYNLAVEEVEKQLQLAVEDRLIEVYRATANKGSNPGTEQDGYRVQPADETEVSWTSYSTLC